MKKRKKKTLPLFVGGFVFLVLSCFIYLQWIYPRFLQQDLEVRAVHEFRAQIKQVGVVKPEVLDRTKLVSYTLSAKIPDTSVTFDLAILCTPVVNAFTFPRGEILILSGILKNMKTESELALLIGHEMGHAVKKHTSKRLRRQVWSKVAWESLFGAGASDSVLLALFQMGLESPFSMEEEVEADQFAISLLHQAGYDVNQAVGLYDQFPQSGGPIFFSSHPEPTKRKEILMQQISTEGLSGPARETEVLPTSFAEPCNP